MAALQYFRKPEVRQHGHISLIEKNVAGFDISMDDPAAEGVSERVGDRSDVGNHLMDVHSPVESAFEGPSSQVRSYQIDRAAVFAEVMHLHDIGMA